MAVYYSIILVCLCVWSAGWYPVTGALHFWARPPRVQWQGFLCKPSVFTSRAVHFLWECDPEGSVFQYNSSFFIINIALPLLALVKIVAKNLLVFLIAIYVKYY